jgi:hypothetical protein
MNFQVMVNGETFVSEEVDQETLKNSESWVYENIPHSDKFSMRCRDGRVVILTQTALENAIFIFDYNKV